MAGKVSEAPVAEFLGQIGCAFCDPEDNILLTDDAALRAWEAEYTAALLETHSEIFANVDDCVIDIIPSTDGATSKA
jgi:sulfur transfer complex TusBCD TusB component (DsrH family)